MQLSAMDANLLVALHALLEERSVVGAARRLSLSPSATSHALARLREVLGDPLLVRAGRALLPTARAHDLRPALSRMVSEMEIVLSPPSVFDPSTLRRAFRLATTDHVQFVLLRGLDMALRRDAPGVDLHFLPLPPRSAVELREAQLDFAIGVFDEPPADIGRRPLFEDRLVSVVRANHPALRGAMTVKRFAELQHVLVAPNGTATGLLDRQLAALGFSRRIARTVPTFLDAPFLVASSDLVVTLPARLVMPLLGMLRLRVLAAPLPLPSFTLSLTWHRRFDEQPAHTWFRELVWRVSHDLETLAKITTASARRRSD